MFALFAVISVNPEGAVLGLIRSVLFGFLGQAGFYFAIPGLLYLFIINTFGRRTAVKMRSICTVVFVTLCGCIFHLTVQSQGMATGINVVPDLYVSGMDGISGGIICGGIALLLKWACGRWVALLLCVLAAILTLLGAIEITIPSLIRAIANRPREEEEEEQEYIDEYNNAMGTDRNDDMHDVAVGYLESGKVVFYAVGLAHLLAEDGLVNTLRAAGYTVELVTFE
jgi:hypothetical protein